MNQHEDPAGRPAAGELRDRAAAGAALLGARAVLVYALGIVANLMLARLLTPSDFGIFALGLVLVTLGTYLAQAGLGGALITRERRPERRELEAVAAAQLGLTTLVAVALAIAAVPFGRDVELIAVMAVSLPIAVLRAPSVVLLERELDYRVIATADLLEAVCFYAWAVGAAALGFGAWGLATAAVARAVAGSATVLLAGPIGVVRPRWSWPHVRALLGFGAKFQAAGIVTTGREQLLNVGIGAVAGLATLGVWTLAWRLMQIPGLLFQTVGRVAFPAMSRLLGAARDPRRILERQIAATAAINAVVVVGLVGFAPALPDLIGDDWNDVPAALFWSGIGLMIAAPAVSTAMAYLFAAGEAGTVAVVMLVSGLVWLAVTLPLLEPFGAAAAGIGWIAAGIANALPLWRRVAARTGAKISMRTALSTAGSLVAACAAWLVAGQPDDRLVGGVLGFLTGELLVLATLLTVGRGTLDDLRTLARQGLRSARDRRE